MKCNFLDLGSASDWLKQISVVARPIGSATLASDSNMDGARSSVLSLLLPSPPPPHSSTWISCLHGKGKRLKRRIRKRNSRQPGRLGTSFRSVLKSTMITWETRDLWKVGNFLFTLRYFRCYLVISEPPSNPSIQPAIPWFISRDEGAYSL